MKLDQQKATQLIIGLFSMAAVAVGATALVYSVYVSRSDAKIVRALGSRLPVASVGGKMIPYGDFLDARDTIKTYFASDAAKKEGFAQPLTPQVEKDALDRLVREEVVKGFAGEKNVSVKDEDVIKSFDELVLSTSTTMPNVAQYLKDTFGWTEKQFQEKVIRPAMLEQQLAAVVASGTPDTSVYEQEVKDRLAKPDVKYYLKIDPTASTSAATTTQ